MIYNFDVPTRVGFQCLSEDTEIYTKYGWKHYDELSINDEIYVFNIDDKTVKRAGLDYWKEVDLVIWKSFDEFLEESSSHAKTL